MDRHLAQSFDRLGISKGDSLTRLNEEAHARPVRVRTAKGEAVLAAGMASKVIVHHDDGHKTPVSEMLPGEHGHVEGLVCGTALEQGLRVLGIQENDHLVLVRHIPPMDYIVLMGGARVSLTEGAATKIWGTVDGREMQFAMAGKGVQFTVNRLIGGARSMTMLERMGLRPGVKLNLESVRPASCAGRVTKDHNVLQAHSGLRIYLRHDQEATVMVEVS